VIDERAIGDRYRALVGELDEARRRRWAGSEALSHGRGGLAAVARATGMSPTTVAKGMREIRSGETAGPDRVRRPGGGRPALRTSDPTLVRDLEALVGGEARGDPESPLLWTAKSVRTLAGALREQGHRVSHETVAKLLRGLGYSLQTNRKALEGASHPDRDAQFGHINQTVMAAIAAGQPAISVDTKKKELIGDFKNGGRQWRPQGQAGAGAHQGLQGQAAGQGQPLRRL
jgi:transposase